MSTSIRIIPALVLAALVPAVATSPPARADTAPVSLAEAYRQIKDAERSIPRADARGDDERRPVRRGGRRVRRPRHPDRPLPRQADADRPADLRQRGQLDARVRD